MPGITQRPVASMVCIPSGSPVPIAAAVSPRTPASAIIGGAPLPSNTVPPRITRSYAVISSPFQSFRYSQTRAGRARSVWPYRPNSEVIGVGSTHMTGALPETWLDLLLAGVSVDAIYHRRDQLVHTGVEPGDAERQAGAAVQLHALLDERRRRGSEVT